ncbi:MAG TPA: acyl-ACP--UDP-N-acetylglucosamine O-acyltransferase [Humisphaera sp.]|jgi:UDP-N-acetylglucosamine acyltransferase|nr:acyl-ACP--UDP-N-acetylglucosamine O-acyltransferase [Humisphaera sp.]
MKQETAKVKEVKRSAWFSSLFQFRFFSDEMPKISPHAVIDRKAEIAEDVEIGPFCVIGPDVKIASGCRLLNNVTVVGATTIGKDNLFHQNAVIGAPPQDKKYKGGSTLLEIGTGNNFREAVTIHAGTEKGGGITRIGDNGLFMVNCHIGHDAIIGNNATFANNVMIAGHVVCEDFVTLGGGVGLHHYVSVGKYAFVAGYARVHHDVPPFCKLDGADQVRGLNLVGMRRAGFSEEDIAALEEAYRRLFSKRTPFSKAMAEFDLQNGINPQVKEMIEFLRRRDSGKHGRYLESLRSKN